MVNYIDPESYRNSDQAHAVMHNNMHFTMIDNNFSVIKLMFFPLHSWSTPNLNKAPVV